jgi:ABC-type antimicrobial peptide transport system permease subunit
VFGRTGRVDQMMVLGKPETDVDALRRDLGHAIDGIGIVSSPGEATGASSDFLGIQLVTTMVGAIVVLAALVLVFHTMSMATAERRTEIALARTLGSTRRQLLVVTLTEAGLLGTAGTIVGLLAGGALARLVVPLARVAYAGSAPVDLPTGVSFQVPCWAPRSRRGPPRAPRPSTRSAPPRITSGVIRAVRHGGSRSQGLAPHSSSSAWPFSIVPCPAS